jgi:2-methylcitrate dehydratase PrpD
VIGRRNFLAGSALLGSTMGLLRPSNTIAQQADGKAPAAVAKPTPRFTYVETRGAPSPENPTEVNALAGQCVSLKYSDLDETTRRKAKQRILDLFGCALGGVHGGGNAALVKTLKAQGGPSEASVIGYGTKMSAANAAMANAVIARSYDFEVMTVVVGDRLIGSHNSPTNCMTALAMCERAGRSGREFMTALIVGDDIAARMLAASGLDLGMGWDASSIFTEIPAAAIAARLYGATAMEARDAMGIVLDMVSGTTQSVWDRAPGWKFVGGLAARNGIFAAELARAGAWAGVGDSLRAGYGLYGQFTAGCIDPGALTADLGKSFYGEEYFKPYPSCNATHGMHECAFQMRDAHNLKPEQIVSIVVKVPAFILSTALAQPFAPDSRDPHTSANFSILFQVANGVLRGPIRLEHYDPSAMNSPEMAEMIRKTTLAPLPEGQSGSEIEVTMKDGSTVTGQHSGTPTRNPSVKVITQEETVEKFFDQVAFSKVVSTSVAKEIVERVSKLEQERNIRNLVKLMRGVG